MPERGLVVIPTYNEAANLAHLVPHILAQDPRLDILIVDDNSPDGTGQLAEALRQKEPRLSVIHREGKLGLGTAYIVGFRWALERDYALVFEMDADLSHDPAYLKDFLKAVEEADLVLGSRYLGGQSRGGQLAHHPSHVILQCQHLCEVGDRAADLGPDGGVQVLSQAGARGDRLDTSAVQRLCVSD